MPTPSNHRTQLGPITQSLSRGVPGSNRNPSTLANRSSQNHTPGQRQPFASISGNAIDRPGVGGSGYGMSAGMKIGRQQGNEISFPYCQMFMTDERQARVSVEVSTARVKAFPMSNQLIPSLNPITFNEIPEATFRSPCTENLSRICVLNPLLSLNCMDTR